MGHLGEVRREHNISPMPDMPAERKEEEIDERVSEVAQQCWQDKYITADSTYCQIMKLNWYFEWKRYLTISLALGIITYLSLLLLNYYLGGTLWQP